MTKPGMNEARLTLGQGLLVAGLYLQSTIVIKSLSPDPLGPEDAQRLMGALSGALVVFYASGASKSLTPIARMPCSPAAEQAFRRSSAWILTLGGLAYGAAWLLAPIDQARALAMSALAASLLVVLARVTPGLLARLRPSRKAER